MIRNLDLCVSFVTIRVSFRMYRLMVDRLSRSRLGSAYTVASIGYRVYPDADTTGQARLNGSAKK